MKFKILTSIGILFITVLGNVYFTFLLEDYGKEKQQWIYHTNKVIISANSFLSSITDMETGQRGYLLTQNTSYLEPFHKGNENSLKQYKILYNLTLDNKIQNKRLKKINSKLLLKIEELNKTVLLVDKKQLNKALSIVKQNNGKQYMDDIRSLLKDFINTEHILLEKRKGEFEANRTQITTLIAVEFLFFIFMSFMVWSFLNKSLFEPMNLLLKGTKKLEHGEKVSIKEITSQDEMGYLLSSFYIMQEKIYKREENLSFKAHHDDLTKLPNRIKMYESIDIAINNANKNNQNVYVLFLDLNKFKDINDTLGHDAGDFVLKEAATRFKSVTREDDMVFRIGGDEFLVLVNNLNKQEEIQIVVDNILKSIKNEVTYKNNQIKIDTSIGIASYPKDTTNNKNLIKYADIAMYHAKKESELNYRYFSKDMLRRQND